LKIYTKYLSNLYMTRMFAASGMTVLDRHGLLYELWGVSASCIEQPRWSCLSITYSPGWIKRKFFNMFPKLHHLQGYTYRAPMAPANHSISYIQHQTWTRLKTWVIVNGFSNYPGRIYEINSKHLNLISFIQLNSLLTTILSSPTNN
jgi:hypothetical protein